MSFRRVAGPFVLASLLCICCVSSHAETVSEAWYVATLDGARVGYLHETVTRTPEGHLGTELVSRLGVKRSGEEVGVEMIERWLETADGVPISYTTTTVTASEELVVKALVDGSTLRIRRESLGEASHGQLPLDDDFRFPHGVSLLHVSRGFKPGDVYTYSSYVYDFDDIGLSEVRVVGSEGLDVMGEVVNLQRLVVTLDLFEGVSMDEWRDDEGRVWKQEVADLGVAYVRCTREEALADVEAAEVMSSAMIPCDVDLSTPAYKIDSALYELWMEGGDVSRYVAEDARQKIEGTTERGILLRVDRVVPEPGTTVQFPIDEPEFEPYLESNPLMQSSNPLIIGTASKSVWGSEGNAWQAAMQIERWVFDTVEHKGLGVAFASALEVLQTLEGDCSEHSVLMAAMTRAVRVPTKLVGGLTYFDGSFAYHMWDEVWVGDGWYALDPTIGLGSVDATHIKLAESSLPGGSTGELSVPVMRMFKKLGVRLVEYSVGDSVVRP